MRRHASSARRRLGYAAGGLFAAGVLAVGVTVATVPASAGTTGTGTGVAGTAQQPGAVVTGAVAAQAAAAALRAVPGATVVRVQLAADGGGYDVYLREQDGTTTLVTLDRNFVVRAVESDVGSDVGVVPGPQQTDHQDEPDTSDQPQDGGFPN